MKIRVCGFDWDAGNAAKCETHGLSRPEIEAFFGGELQIVHDLKHSLVEDRFIAVGYGPKQRPMLVIFSLRERDAAFAIRPISARFMHPKEARKYEKTHPKVQE